MPLIHSPVTPIPDTAPAAVPALWNDRYTEIDDNFTALNYDIVSLSSTVTDLGSDTSVLIETLTQKLLIETINRIIGDSFSSGESDESWVDDLSDDERIDGALSTNYIHSASNTRVSTGLAVTGNAESIGTGFSTYPVGATVCAVDDAKYLVVTTTKAMILSVDPDGSITAGAQLTHGLVFMGSAKVTKLDTDKAILVYMGSDGLTMYAVVFTVSGTAVSVHTPVANTDTFNIYIQTAQCAQIDTNKVVVTGRGCCVISVTDTTPVWGTWVSTPLNNYIPGYYEYYVFPDVKRVGTNKFIALYMLNGTQIAISVGTVSGFSVTFGAPYIIGTPGWPQPAISVISSDRVLVAYYASPPLLLSISGSSLSLLSSVAAPGTVGVIVPAGDEEAVYFGSPGICRMTFYDDIVDCGWDSAAFAYNGYMYDKFVATDGTTIVFLYVNEAGALMAEAIVIADTSNMTLVFDSFSPDVQPASASVMAVVETDGVINTDVNFYVSNNDGTDYRKVTLEALQSGINNRQVLFGTVAISDTGTTTRVKIEAVRPCKIHDVAYLKG